MPFQQRSRKKMIMHKYVMDKDLEKYLFEQHTTHGHILETGKTKQTSKNDYHMWCVDKHGNIKDVYAIHHPDIKLTYKEWKTTPSYYKDMIERKLKAFNTWTKEDKIKYGRLVKCFRNNRYFYIREIFVDGKKLNIPLI